MPGSPVVLDSHALLAYFRGEPAAAHVRDLLDKAARAGQMLHLTEVNYAEVKYITLRKDGETAWKEAARVLETLPIAFHPADRHLADLAADFKARFPISLADAFAAALAKARNAQLITGDPEFKALESAVRIAWLK
ncbi:PIN domain-containing protein [bacterium]|nr:PIN domain-containing protein [bacterium]